MAHTGSCPVGRARIGRPTFLGLVAAAAWLVGLVVGVSALITGHPVVAAVSVVLALGAPWLGLAWNLHARLRADDVRLRFPNSGLPLTAA
jgi:Flp pilus assembly protein TadB